MAANPNRTQLDQQQILQRVMDETNDRLRTDASFSGNIDVDLTIEVNAADGDSVLSVGTEDGTVTGVQHVIKIDSANNLIVKDIGVATSLASANVTLSALLAELNQKTEPSDAQNIRALSSATDSILVPGVATAANQTSAQISLTSIDSKLTSPLTVNLPGSATSANQVLAQGSLTSIDAKLTSPLTVTLPGSATAANQVTAQTSLSSIDSKLTSPLTVTSPGSATSANQVLAQSSLTSIDSKLTSPLTVTLPGSATSANQVTAQASLSSIDAKLTSPLVVTGTIAVGDLHAFKDDVAIAGTENGLASGTVRHFVNNRRGQILASHDRIQSIAYADFGTKDQRVTSITYTSPTFPGITALKNIVYTLIGTRYRRDSITWSIT